MAESYQIYLNSKYATSYFNNTYKFSLNTLEIDEGHYIYLSIVHVSIPYSFYNVHENNNRLEYISNNLGYVINIPVSNYNINQLISYLSSAMPSFTITYSNKTNKITFKHSTYDFTILSSSTCYRILGFDENKSYTSYGTILVSSNCINLMTINSIFLLSNLLTYNISSSIPNSQNILCQIPVDNGPNSLIHYYNKNGFRTNLFLKYINDISLRLVDEYNNDINLNGLHFRVTIQLDIEPFK
jgi:hypothetical protein